MTNTDHHMIDLSAAAVLMTTPWWWPAVNAYGQLVLLVLGVAVALLRGAVLIRDLRRKG